MFSLIWLENILSNITEVILCITTIVGILKFEKAWQKCVSMLILLVSLSSIGLGFYLQSGNNSISANLHLSVYHPLVINRGGTYVDEYLEDADYRVLCAASYPLDTKFTLTITNMKTLEKNEYVISDVYGGKDIGVFDAGRYKLELYDGTELFQTDYIVLSSKNLENDGNWDYTIYTMDGFYNMAVPKQIILDEATCKLIDTWAFTIYTDAAYVYRIFDTDIVNGVGAFEGEFYFLPGRYYLNNAVTSGKMNEIIIDIE